MLIFINLRAHKICFRLTLMTINKAKTELTATRSNLDGLMKYAYELTGPNSFRLIMLDSVSGKIRQLSFELKSPKRGYIEVEFACHGFCINFPLKKNVSNMTFKLTDFIGMIEMGVKIDRNELNPQTDLEVEF
jgi:hypothetical protein